jgi:hypothetical protein
MKRSGLYVSLKASRQMPVLRTHFCMYSFVHVRTCVDAYLYVCAYEDMSVTLSSDFKMFTVMRRLCLSGSFRNKGILPASTHECYVCVFVCGTNL